MISLWHITNLFRNIKFWKKFFFSFLLMEYNMIYNISSQCLHLLQIFFGNTKKKMDHLQFLKKSNDIYKNAMFCVCDFAGTRIITLFTFKVVFNYNFIHFVKQILKLVTHNKWKQLPVKIFIKFIGNNNCWFKKQNSCTFVFY